MIFGNKLPFREHINAEVNNADTNLDVTKETLKNYHRKNIRIQNNGKVSYIIWSQNPESS